MGFSNGLKIFFYAIILGFFSSGLVWFFTAQKYDFMSTWALSAIVLLPVAYWLQKMHTKCKNCGANWSREEVGIETISERQKESIKTEGDEKFRVIINIHEYWQHYKCKECGHATKSRKQSENEEGRYQVS